MGGLAAMQDLTNHSSADAKKNEFSNASYPFVRET